MTLASPARSAATGPASIEWTAETRELHLRNDRISYVLAVWPAGSDGLARANEGVRGGDELMRAGLLLAANRDEGAPRGDFWARLFVVEAE